MSDKKHRKEAIAAGVRGHRARAKETQKELADSLDVDQTTVSAWENTGCVGAADAWALADHWGISLDELAGRRLDTA